MLEFLRSAGRKAPAAVVVAALFGVVFGCGGGGGGGTPSTCVDFVSATPMPGASTVTAQDGPGSTCSAAQVRVVVTDVANVFGAGFEIRFSPAAVRFSGVVDVSTSFLGNDAVPLQALASELEPGRWLISITRLSGTAPGIDFVGSHDLCRLVFTRVGSSGTSALTFADETLFDDATPPVAIPNVTWTGGTFSID